jgi:hypothetical protein
MTTTADTPDRSAPWHFWVVAVVSLIWNCIGGFDYTMSHLQGEAYMRGAGMSEAQIAFMATYPTWMHAVWAIGVWGSVLGSILFLLRSKWAFHAFVASTLGAAGALAYTATVGDGAKVMGLMFPVIIVAICLVFTWYAWTMTKRGVLR